MKMSQTFPKTKLNVRGQGYYTEDNTLQGSEHFGVLCIFLPAPLFNQQNNNNQCIMPVTFNCYLVNL